MAYSAFTDNTTPIKFFYGLQADLTPYIKGQGKGTEPNVTYCIEGAFYLTTDTQKLYVGRKNSTDNKVYAVQVSRGVTFVTSTRDLPTPGTDDIEEGELYYITSENVLAALVYNSTANPPAYTWTQINPPTGINNIQGNTSAELDGNSSPTGNVILTNGFVTDGGTQYNKTKFIAGNNITLTANGQETIDNIAAGKFTISATDTTYTMGTEATASGETDGATIELAINGNAADTNNTKINISGSGTVAVTSDANGNIDVHGPTFTSLTATGYQTGNADDKTGFVMSLNGTNGDGASFNAIGDFDPGIKIGNTERTVKFLDGVADLDVYTIAETNDKIDEKIDEKLATANAMTYCGTIAPTDSPAQTFAEAFRAAVIANGGAHNGDVYKISGLDTSVSTIDGKEPSIGDLIIIHGTEETSGNYKGQIKIGNTGVTGTPGSYTAENAYTANGILAICDLVPSGDEPQINALTNPSDTNSNPSIIALRDGNNSNSNVLYTTFQGNNKIEVTSAKISSITTGDSLAVTINHATTSRIYNLTSNPNGDKNDLTLTTSNSTDTIGDGKYSLFVLNGYEGLKTDNYGHVTGLQGKTITFEHNKVTALTASYGVGDSSGLITLDRTDTIGSTLASANKAQIKLTSNTLTMSGNDTNKELNIELVWHSF